MNNATVMSIIETANLMVFPLQSGTKRPALKGDWREHATSEPKRIAAWLTAGLDLAAIVPAGYMVLDPDVDEAKGTDGFATLASYPALPKTRTATTPRGGKHLWFKLPEGVHLRCGEFAPHVDIKASGNGYVKFHGSNAGFPNPYSQDFTVEAVEAPQWVLERAKTTDRTKAHTEDTSAVLEHVGAARIEFERALAHADETVERNLDGWDDAASSLAWYTAHMICHKEEGIEDIYYGHPLIADLDADSNGDQRGSRKLADKLAILEPQYANRHIDDEERDTKFWESTATLVHVANHAEKNGANKWAVLGNSLAIAIATTPVGVMTDSYNAGSLNFALAPIAPSGGGKGRAWSAAESAFTWPHYHTDKAGSGEVIPMLYQTKVGKGADATYESLRESVLLRSGEIGEIAAKAGRSGSTLFEVVKSAWSGEELKNRTSVGTSDASLAKDSYRFVFCVDVQPARANMLFDEAAGGLPQRFLWVDANRVRPNLTVAERRALARKGVLTKPMDWENPFALGENANIGLPESADADIEADELHQFEHPEDEGSGHAMFTRIKVASALAVLHQERNISDDLWALAGQLMERSKVLSEGAKAVLHAEGMKAARAKAKYNAATKRYEEEETTKLTAKAMTNEQYAEHLIEQMKAYGPDVSRTTFLDDHGGQYKRRAETLKELEAAGRVVKFKDPENSRKNLIKAA